MSYAFSNNLGFSVLTGGSVRYRLYGSWGLLALDRGVLRGHLPVVDGGGSRIGETTSGTFSPTLGVGIALALIDTVAGVVEGDEIGVDVRGRTMRVRVVKPPFVPAHVR